MKHETKISTSSTCMQRRATNHLCRTTSQQQGNGQLHATHAMRESMAFGRCIADAWLLAAGWQFCTVYYTCMQCIACIAS